MNEDRELPFLEKDFSIWMDRLEKDLLTSPNWKNLLVYRDISVYDSAYSDIYWGMLEAYREYYGSSSENAKIAITHTKGYLSENISQLVKGKMTFKRFVESSVRKIDKKIGVYFPPKKFHNQPESKRALVIRAFRNTSAFPVLSAMKNDGWNVLFASWNEKLEEPVKKIGIPYIDIKNFYRRMYYSTVSKHQNQIETILRKIDCYLPGRLLAKISGFPLEVDAKDLLLRNIVQVRTNIDIYMDLIEQFRPDAVVLFNENSMPGRTMANVARANNVCSVSIQHGLFIGYVYRRLATDKMIVWGEIPKKFWLDRGCSEDQVISAGAFSHENWSTGLGNKYLRDRNNRHRVLFLGQNPAAFISQSTHKKTIKAIFDSVQKMSQYDFIIRPHPREYVLPYHEAYNELLEKSNVVINNDGSVEDAIRDCDLVVTIFSTAGLEAMLLRRPVIVIDLSGDFPLAPYISAAKLVRDPLSLPAAIHEVLENPVFCHELIDSGDRYCEGYLGPRDGQASTRAARVIQDLSSEQKTW